MDWQLLITTFGALAAGALITHLTGSLAQTRQHKLDLAMREADAASTARVRERDRRYELRREALRPVFEVLDACEAQLTISALTGALEKTKASAEFKAIMKQLEPMTSEQRERFERELLRHMNGGTDVPQWGGATLIRQLTTSFRLEDEALRLELSGIVGALTLAPEKLDVAKVANTIGRVRERVEAHVAREPST